MANKMRMARSMSKEMGPAKAMLCVVHSFVSDYIRLMTVGVRFRGQAIRERESALQEPGPFVSCRDVAR